MNIHQKEARSKSITGEVEKLENEQVLLQKEVSLLASQLQALEQQKDSQEKSMISSLEELEGVNSRVKEAKQVIYTLQRKIEQSQDMCNTISK